MYNRVQKSRETSRKSSMHNHSCIRGKWLQEDGRKSLIKEVHLQLVVGLEELSRWASVIGSGSGRVR